MFVRFVGATALAEGGCSVLHLKQAGGWASSTVAEHYIAESLRARTVIANTMGLCKPVAQQSEEAPATTITTDATAAALNALTAAVTSALAKSAAIDVAPEDDSSSDSEDEPSGLMLRLTRRK